MKRVAEKEQVIRAMDRFLLELNHESKDGFVSTFVGDYDNLTAMIQEEYDSGQTGSEYVVLKDLYDCIGPIPVGIEETD